MDKFCQSIMNLMERVDFFKNKDIDSKTFRKSMALSYDRPEYHQFMVRLIDSKLKAHCSRIRIENRECLIHHMVAERGYGTPNLMDMAKKLVNEFNEWDWVHCLYRIDNEWPTKVFGGIYEAVLSEPDDKGICYQKPYGYIKPVNEIWAVELGSEPPLVDHEFYLPLRLKEIRLMRYSNPFIVRAKYNAFKADGEYIGTVTKIRSLPYLNASGLLDADYYDLVTDVKFGWLNHDPMNERPILWNPITAVIDEDPQKVYNHWKIKMDKKSFKYFGM